MINKEALEKIKTLENEYNKNWGKSVDYTIIPQGVTQEKMVEILERIVNTGESILVGYEKIKMFKQAR